MEMGQSKSEIAAALDVPRELVGQWETGRKHITPAVSFCVAHGREFENAKQFGSLIKTYCGLGCERQRMQR
tara:strand:- start:159 stop:371 length:213 start_codon:yes stop_codon:yes gene_type:complete